jgi:hypothetical protein
MKKIIYLSLLLLAVTAVSGQRLCKKNVPVEVKSKFELLYPQVNSVKWTEEEGEFEAEFIDKEVETSVLIDSKGNLLETEQEIPVSTLPEPVTNYLANTYPGKHITEAAKITDANGKITYEAEIVHKDVMFDKDGEFIGETGKQN